MSLGSTLKHALGFIAGILIPGASKSATNSIHAVQQELADLYGQAATKLAGDLKTNTALSGPEKVFHIVEAIYTTAKAQGFSGVESVLKDAALDLAQTAYRNSLPTIEQDAKNLLISVHLAPLTPVVDLLAPLAEKAADSVLHLGADQVQHQAV